MITITEIARRYQTTWDAAYERVHYHRLQPAAVQGNRKWYSKKEVEKLFTQDELDDKHILTTDIPERYGIAYEQVCRWIRRGILQVESFRCCGRSVLAALVEDIETAVRLRREGRYVTRERLEEGRENPATCSDCCESDDGVPCGWYTIGEISGRLGHSYCALWKWANTRKLPCIRVGRRCYYELASFQAHYVVQEQKPQQRPLSRTEQMLFVEHMRGKGYITVAEAQRMTGWSRGSIYAWVSDKQLHGCMKYKKGTYMLFIPLSEVQKLGVRPKRYARRPGLRVVTNDAVEVQAA